MLNALKGMVRRSPFAGPLIRIKSLAAKPRSQNGETAILAGLIARHDIPKRFIELGFSGWEFNCASLVEDWKGLLVDADPYNSLIARSILPNRIRTETRWLTLQSLEIVHRYGDLREIGVLSIDLDGNDYWFLENLISLRPAIIIAEYNPVFGHRPITVPYDPGFDRRIRSRDWTYYGASLSALTNLAEANHYRLVTIGKVNAFFLRDDLMAGETALAPAFTERPLANGMMPSECWADIAHLPYVDVRAPLALACA